MFKVIDPLIQELQELKLFSQENMIHIFSAVNNANILAGELIKDLQKISKWVYKWKK